LIAVSEKDAPRLVKALQANGDKAATTIGYAAAREQAWVRLV
jgi:hydrogenase maturation factor